MPVHFAHFRKAYDLVVYNTVQFLFCHKGSNALLAYYETVICQQFNGLAHSNAAYFKCWLILPLSSACPRLLICVCDLLFDLFGQLLVKRHHRIFYHEYLFHS